MATIKTLLAKARETDGALLEIADQTAPYSYRDFVGNSWKSGNLLGHFGVHPGAEVTVLVGRKQGTAEPDTAGIDAADPLYALLGATLLGATVRLDPVEPVDSRAVVGPATEVGSYATTSSCSVIAYGGPPDSPGIVHFEAEMWSENPVEPPERVTADDPAIEVGNERFTHGTLVGVAEELSTEYGLGPGETVVLDASLTEPGAVVAGVLAPIAAGATIRVQPDVDGASALVVTETKRSGESAVQATTVTERLRDTRRV